MKKILHTFFPRSNPNWTLGGVILAYSFYKHTRRSEFGTDKRKSSGIPKTNPDGGHGAERDLNSGPFTWPLLPFIRIGEAVSLTQRFLTRKFGPKIEVYLWRTNLKANVCRNSTFQVNRKKNDKGRRRLTSRNRAAIFISTSCKGRHNKPFWLWTWRVNRKQESSTFLLR